MHRFKEESTSRKGSFRRGGRVVDCGGLENRCAARHPGFESLSLRNKGCKSSICEIYTLFYTQECKIGSFLRFFKRIRQLQSDWYLVDWQNELYDEKYSYSKNKYLKYGIITNMKFRSYIPCNSLDIG